LRRAGKIAAMEWENTNLPVNFEDSPLMKESFDRVRAEADANRLLAVITETLQKKFPNDVPADLNSRLTALPAVSHCDHRAVQRMLREIATKSGSKYAASAGCPRQFALVLLRNWRA
jgi:hypothetical protein